MSYFLNCKSLEYFGTFSNLKFEILTKFYIWLSKFPQWVGIKNSSCFFFLLFPLSIGIYLIYICTNNRRHSHLNAMFNYSLASLSQISNLIIVFNTRSHILTCDISRFEYHTEVWKPRVRYTWLIFEPTRSLYFPRLYLELYTYIRTCECGSVYNFAHFFPLQISNFIILFLNTHVHIPKAMYCNIYFFQCVYTSNIRFFSVFVYFLRK